MQGPLHVNDTLQTDLFRLRNLLLTLQLQHLNEPAGCIKQQRQAQGRVSGRWSEASKCTLNELSPAEQSGHDRVRAVQNGAAKRQQHPADAVLRARSR